MNYLKTTFLLLTILLSNLSFAKDDVNKVALITGSSSGLGYELALLAMQQKMDLVLVDINPKASKKLMASYKKQGGNAIVIRSDLSVSKQRSTIIKKAVKAFGRIDYLFNNAGYSHLSNFSDLDLAESKDLFEVNYWAYVDLAQQVVPVMKQQKSGAIINTVSILGVVPSSPPLASYAGSKFALIGFFQAISSELKQSGISVKLVCPAGMKTNILTNAGGNLAPHLQHIDDDWEPPSIVAKEIFEQLDDGKLFQFPSGAQTMFDDYVKGLSKSR